MLTFKDPPGPGDTQAVPVNEKIKKMAAGLEKEFADGPYMKYEIKRQSAQERKKELEEELEEGEEDFSWYSYESTSTYFCMTLDNALYYFTHAKSTFL